MSDRRFNTPYSQYFEGDSLPSKYKDELDQIFSTAQVIHGTRFVQHIKFLVNLEALLGVLISNMEPKDGVPLDFLRDSTSHIAVQLSASHSDALGLTEKQREEAINICKTMRGVLETMERDLKKKGKL